MAAMQLNVLYFAHAKERVGFAEESLTCPEVSCVRDVLELLTESHATLAPLIPYLRVAVNGHYVELGHQLSDGDEFALIPPVSGGSDLKRVLITEQALDLRACRDALNAPENGAIVCFEGVVRDHARGHSVTRIDYEAYRTMAERELKKILEGVEEEWPGTHTLVHHRVGTLVVGEVAVVVVVASPHRREAFAACQAIIDRLKERVPIWKREHGPDGASWVSDRP